MSYHSFNSLHFLDREIRVARAIEAPTEAARPSALLAAVEYRLTMSSFLESRKRNVKAVVPSRGTALYSDLAGYYRQLIQLGREHKFITALANASLAVTLASPDDVIDFYEQVFHNTWRILAATEAHDRLIRDISHDEAVPFIDTTKGLNGEWDADLFD